MIICGILLAVTALILILAVPLHLAVVIATSEYINVVTVTLSSYSVFIFVNIDAVITPQ